MIYSLCVCVYIYIYIIQIPGTYWYLSPNWHCHLIITCIVWVKIDIYQTTGHTGSCNTRFSDTAEIQIVYYIDQVLIEVNDRQSIKTVFIS